MVFAISAIFISFFVVIGLFFPEQLAYYSSKALDVISVNYGWFYLLVVFAIVLFCLYLAMSRFGNIKLGRDNDEPEFSNISWYGMLFSAGMGIGLIFYGIGEPVSHFVSPPPGVVETDVARARAALRYSFFHWGIHSWSLYAFVGLVMGYFMHRTPSKNLISSALRPLIGDLADGWLGKTIDILSIVAVVYGISASLGTGVLQINSGLNYLFGIAQSNMVKIIIIVVLAIAYIVSSSTGLEKGIKYLSNTNLAIAVALLLFVFTVGPTTFILEVFTTTLGSYFDSFISTSLNLSPFTDTTWTKDWTLMYWAWWISWSPFVGLFIARVSRGRTIREFIISVILIPSLFSFIWFSVFGGTGISLEMYEGANVAQAILNDLSTATFATLQLLPLGRIISIVALVLVITFFITSADSATFVLGMLSSDGDLHPPVSRRITWGVLQAAIAAVLILSGGIDTIQNIAIIFALPFSIVLVLMCISLYKALDKDYRHKRQIEKRKEKELMKVLKEMSEEYQEYQDYQEYQEQIKVPEKEKKHLLKRKEKKHT